MDNIKDIVSLLEKDEISSKIAKEIIAELLDNGGVVSDIIDKKGLKQISNESDILNVINTILDNNPKSIEDYNNGLDRAVKFLMGQVMKETKGKANPKMANDLLVRELENRK